ncbi:MAG: hypothetical protein ACFCUV_18055 [Rivularia sp. (in: cyanobacteria)]
MVWNILLQAAVGFFVGAAVGYGVSAIIEVLSKAFANLWKEFVSAASILFEYLTDATKYYLALIAQFLENNWKEIESYLNQEFGYRTQWLITVFRHGVDTIIAFQDSKNLKKESRTISIKPMENQENVQLPTMQDKPIIATLSNVG